MTFDKNSTINFVVDDDIRKNSSLHAALQTALNQWELVLGNITFNKTIKYQPLGIDESFKTDPNFLARWNEFEKQFINGHDSNNTIMIVLEDKGGTATGSFNLGYSELTKQTIKTGLVVLPRTRWTQKTPEEQIDLISHELGHAFNIPHIQDPFSVEGFFDNQAVMFNATIFDLSLRQFNANMDPVSSDFARGLQESDKHVIRHFYPGKMPGYIHSDFYGAVKGSNLALIGRSKQASIKDSVAMPSVNDKINFYHKPGRYSLYLRKASTKGGALSGVWSGHSGSSFKDGSEEYWFYKQRGNTLLFRKPRKPADRLITINLQKDRQYTIEVK